MSPQAKTQRYLGIYCIFLGLKSAFNSVTFSQCPSEQNIPHTEGNVHKHDG